MKYALLIDDNSLPFLSMLVKSEGECGVPNLEIYPFRVLILYVLFIFPLKQKYMCYLLPVVFKPPKGASNYHFI